MDAREVLGIGLDAGPQEIRAAYLCKIKEHPPDKSPEEFEKIRDAYEILNDPRRRMRDLMASADPFAPFVSLVAGMSAPRRFTGPAAWLEALKAK